MRNSTLQISALALATLSLSACAGTKDWTVANLARISAGSEMSATSDRLSVARANAAIQNDTEYQDMLRTLSVAYANQKVRQARGDE